MTGAILGGSSVDQVRPFLAADAVASICPPVEVEADGGANDPIGSTFAE